MAPARVIGPVSYDSIATTLLRAANVPCDSCLGSDLRISTGDRVVEGELPPKLTYRVAGGYKLVVDGESGRRSLFDLRHDPAEQRDLAAERPEMTDALSVGLGSSADVWAATEEQLERLRALGYVYNYGQP